MVLFVGGISMDLNSFPLFFFIVLTMRSLCIKTRKGDILLSNVWKTFILAGICKILHNVREKDG